MSALRVTVFACSLRADSRSRRLACEVERLVAALGHRPTLVDLRDRPPPPFDDDACFATPRYAELHRAVAGADGIVLCAPVYNWGLGGTTRALIELTGATSAAGRGAAWFDKVVTFVAAGGLPHSHMAFGATALALMLDFRCVVNPYSVYATDRDWSAEGAPTAELADRLETAVAVGSELGTALRRRTYRSTWSI